MSFLWGDREFAQGADSVAADGDQLIVTVRGERAAALGQLLRDDGIELLHDKPISGILEDGVKFEAKFAALAVRSFSSIEGETFVISGFRWILSRSADTPRYYIGRLEGLMSGHYRGNLRLEKEVIQGAKIESSSSSGNYRFSGRNVYYIIRADIEKKEDSYLLVDTNERKWTPHHDTFHEDFQALQFILGKQLHIKGMHGVTEDGEILSFVGGDYGEEHPSDASEPPVPSMFPASCWSALLFEQLTTALDLEGNIKTGIMIALDWYIRSLGNHLDDRYIRLYIGLKAIAYWSSRGVNLESRNSDPKDLIKDVCRRYDIAIFQEVERELETLSWADMSGSMTIGKTRNVMRDMDRIALVRTISIAIICRLANYKGEILGWERDRVGRYQSAMPGWWIVDPSTKDKVDNVYVAIQREIVRDRIMILVEGPSDAYIVQGILAAAGYPKECFYVHVANGRESLLKFTEKLPAKIAEKTIVVIEDP